MRLMINSLNMDQENKLPINLQTILDNKLKDIKPNPIILDKGKVKYKPS